MADVGFVGVDTYDYTVMDDDGETSTATVTVTVTDPPIVTSTYRNRGRPKLLTDEGTFTSTIEITDAVAIQDINVQLDIRHRRVSDLDVFLVSAAGTRIELFTDVGRFGDHFKNTVLDDDAATSIEYGTAPYEATFRPEGDLSMLEGENLNGTWTLEITDDRAGRLGRLRRWTLIVDHF